MVIILIAQNHAGNLIIKVSTAPLVQSKPQSTGQLGNNQGGTAVVLISL